MKTYSFEGRVALVTGAGRGLGMNYVVELARRGAAVMINDIGIDPHSTAHALANRLAKEGHCVAYSTASVADEAQAIGLVEGTVREFGRIDVVVNNAGNSILGKAQSVPTADFMAVLAVHLFGTFWIQRAALGYMRTQGYGRIINSASALGAFGRSNAASYVTAKAGIIGLTKAAALDNTDVNIKVNALCPIAYTPMNTKFHDDMNRFTHQQLDVSRVTPAMLFLAHEDCPVSGEVISAGLGRVARVFTATPPGYSSPDLSCESVFANVAKIMDPTDYLILASSDEQYEKIF